MGIGDILEILKGSFSASDILVLALGSFLYAGLLAYIIGTIIEGRLNDSKSVSVDDEKLRLLIEEYNKSVNTK